jgi:hypothetical protein
LRHQLLSTIASVVSKGGIAAALFFFAVIADPELYGVAIHLYAIVQAAGLLISGGAGSFFATTRLEPTEWPITILIVGCWISFCGILIALWIFIADQAVAHAIFGTALGTDNVWLAACVVVLQAFLLSSNGALIGRKLLKQSSLSTLLYGCVSAAGILLIGAYSLVYFLLSLAVGLVIAVAFNLNAMRDTLAPAFGSEALIGKTAKKVGQFGLPSTLAAASGLPVIAMMHSALLQKVGNTTAFSEFMFGFQVRTLVSLVPMVFLSMSAASLRDSFLDENRLTRGKIKFVTAAIYVLVAMASVLALYVLDGIWPFRTSSHLVFANIGLAGLLSVYAYLEAVIVVRRLMWWRLAIGVFCAGVAIVLNYWLMEAYGVWATLIAISASTILQIALYALALSMTDSRLGTSGKAVEETQNQDG